MDSMDSMDSMDLFLISFDWFWLVFIGFGSFSLALVASDLF